MLADGTMHAHSSEIPTGRYKKAHRHAAGTHVHAVDGTGYSLLSVTDSGGAAVAAATLGLLTPDIKGVEVGKLGKRIYRDKLELKAEEDGRRHFHLYGDDPSHHHEEGTDIAAVGRGCIAVTPIRYDLTDHGALEMVSGWSLGTYA